MAPTSRNKEGKRQSMANARACAVEDRHSNAQKVPPLTSDPSHVLRVCLDLHIVFVAANDVSGEQLMRDCPADAASPPPGELCRIAIVTRDPLSLFLSSFSH